MKIMEAVSLKDVALQDSFWTKWQQLVRETVIPYQWDALNDAIPGIESSHTIRNFRLAAGEAEGHYHGMVFQDSDLGKWLETVGFTLSLQRDENLERIADGVIDLIGRAQQRDGYLNTFFTVARPDKRWTNLRDDHELYCTGHLIEAAVAYYEATGKSKLLDIMSRMVDHIASVLGTEPGKLRGYCGHPEIELALMKLYRVTGDRKHLELCRYFIEERGQNPHFFDLESERRGERRSAPYNKDYSQSHLPIREQDKAEGHSVRAVYLYSGTADLAAELNDESLFEACKRLWKNVVTKRMYVTGGIGSSQYQEAFTVDYDLTNDRAYTETCASIGLMFWAHRMLQIEGDSEYADVMERALYNGVLSGMSLDGKSYFYVNPLEVWPAACGHRNDMSSVKGTRQSWFGCACCPPNIARLLASLGQYVYSHNAKKGEAYVHLYTGSKVDLELAGQQVQIVQQTNYPWNGDVDLQLSLQGDAAFTLALRIPAWCRDARISINGEKIGITDSISKGYAKISRVWRNGDRIALSLSMQIEIVRSNPNVRENAGKIALQRGPVIFCLEEADNGPNLRDISLPADSKLTARFEEQLLEGVHVISGTAWRSDPESNEDALYRTEGFKKVPAPVKAVPYYAWSNRQPGEMLVWIREH